MIRLFLRKPVKRSVSSLVLFAFLLSNFFFPVRAFALTSGPSQPEFDGFQPAGASDMVDLFTGDFSYNIPLLDVEGYPVNIAYNANVKMEQEASWVGLGWSLNPGTVRRGVRGLPDEFNGDGVQRRVAMKDYTTYGGLTGISFEVAGKEGDMAVNGAIATGASYNNYKGWGTEIATDVGLSANMQEEGSSGCLTAGLGVSFQASTFDGVEFAPWGGLTGSYNKIQKTGNSNMGASLGVNYSPSVNSRSGVWNQTWSAAISGSYGSGVQPKGTKDNAGNLLSKNNGGGIGVNLSTTSLGSSTAFSPSIPFNMTNSAWSVDIKAGFGSCLVAFMGSIRGFYSSSKITRNDNNYNAFGYLSEQYSNSDNSMLDFSREKDGVTYKESTNLPLASHDYDMYSMTAQGMAGVFRSHRNDIGTVCDVQSKSHSSNNAFGGEIATDGDGVNVGLNYTGTFSSESAGKWSSGLQSVCTFMDPNLLLAGTSKQDECSYPAFAGEKTPGDDGFRSMLGNDNPIQAQLSKVDNETYSTTATYDGGGTVGTNVTAFTSSRKPRNRHISFMKTRKAKDSALEKKIRDYYFSGIGLNSNHDLLHPLATEIDRDNIASGTGLDSRINDHISEITSTNVDGTRYVYGIPVYNLYQKDVTFSTNSSVDASTGYVNYTAGSENEIYAPDKSKGNNYGKEGFLSATITPPYAHSYLLTAVLSPDYVDLTGDGPTTDDYGTYVRFNYSRGGPYAWRVPVSGSIGEAVYNEGFYSDPKDNKGSYTYGVKDTWYLTSVETRNYFAYFDIGTRNDNYGVSIQSAPTLASFSAESSAFNTSQATPYLSTIRLYHKRDVTTPIKTVHFSYDYSLCKNVPNQSTSGDGKLTLKKIWFTYGNSPTTKGILSPYEFAYNDQADHNFAEDGGSPNANPDYNPTKIDRWGNYRNAQPYSLDNVRFPYVDQSLSRANQDMDSRAWCLNTIKTPSGGVIKVDYEADDYAYIMEKRAGQMFPLIGFASASGLTPQSNLYYDIDNPYEYAVVNISSMPIPGSLTAGQAAGYISDNYTNTLRGKLYFKAKVQLSDQSTSNEFVPGYGDIVSVTPVKSTGSGDYDRLYIRLALVNIGDKKHSSTMINPVTKAALQMGRRFLQDIMYHDAVSDGTFPSPLQGIMQLAGMAGDALTIIGGVNRRFIKKNYCQALNTSESFVRLNNPNKKKVGGGNRVKKIEVSDSWGSMISSESTHSYTQIYDYTITDDNNNVMSTGVASYEPLLGGDENSYRYPVFSSYSSNLSVNDELMVEEPVGETLLPDAIVGYSKITVTNQYDTPSGKTVTKHGTGKTEHEFYTAKDFPAVIDQTGMTMQVVKPKKILQLLKVKNKEKLFATQGYRLILNDMHGKPKSVRNYAEGQLGAISGITYDYKQNGNQLANTVSVIDEGNNITSEEVGVDMDVINDARTGTSKMQTFSISVNISTFDCDYWIPLVFIWPGYCRSENDLYTLSTTKTVFKYGILDKVTAFQNKSTVVTQNVLFDKETGEVLLTKTNNEYEDPVFNFTYPAHWVYKGMAGSYKTCNIKFMHTPSSAVIASDGRIISSGVQNLLYPGDEVVVYNATSAGAFTSAYTETSYVGKYWVVQDRDPSSSTPNAFYLLDQNGTKASLSTGSNLAFEVIRSGRRNQQNAPIGSLITMKDPEISGGINPDVTTKVVGSKAMEYDDKWNLYTSYEDERETEESCTPIYDATNYSLFKTLFECNMGTNTWDIGLPGWTGAPNTMSLKLYNGGGPLTYGGTPTPWSVVYPTSCTGISGTQFNTLYYGMNSFTTPPQPYGGSPIPFMWPSWTDPWNDVYLVLTYNTTTKNYELKLQRVKRYYGWPCSDCNFGVVTTEPTDGSCTIVLQRVGGAPGTDPAFPAQFSSLISSGISFGYNSIDVDINVGTGNSHNGTYRGTVCANVVTGFNCTSTGCANSSGNINPYYQNIRGQYHPKRSFGYMDDRAQAGTQSGGVMKGDIRDDGVYSTFLPFWNYSSANWTPVYKLSSETTDPLGMFNKWFIESETNKTDRNGNTLQVQNTLRKPSAALYGYDYTRRIASASNALYTDIANDNFEDYDYVRDQCIEHFRFYDDAFSVSNKYAHTGRYSLAVSTAKTAKVTCALSSLASCRYDNNPNLTPYTLSALNNYDLTYDPYAPYSSSGLYGIQACDQAGRFSPQYGINQTYVLSFWVKQEMGGSAPIEDYGNCGAAISLNSSPIGGSPKKSKIVNGWQKFEYVFNVSSSTVSGDKIKVELNTTWPSGAYFDDVRIHPFNSSMAASVYDPLSMRLMAELDDRNFATFYEYDEEGTLVRVKKETENGISTIKEVRSGLYKH